MKSSIYTRNGDAGQTGLVDGTPVRKGDVRIDAYGTIDEANAHVGLVLAALAPGDLHEILTFLSHRLYNCSSHLAFGAGEAPGKPRVSQDDVAFLERAIDFLGEKAVPVGGFILCGAGEVSARLHVARTVIRRAERILCRLYEEEPGDGVILRFINRASDLAFAAARCASTTDTMWDPTFPVPRL